MGRTSIYFCFCGVLSAAGGDPTAKPVELLLEADPVLAGYSSLCRDDAESVVAGYVCNVERRGRKTAHLIELGVRAVSAAHTLPTHVRVNYHELSLLQVDITAPPGKNFRVAAIRGSHVSIQAMIKLSLSNSVVTEAGGEKSYGIPELLNHQCDDVAIDGPDLTGHLKLAFATEADRPQPEWSVSGGSLSYGFDVVEVYLNDLVLRSPESKHKDKHTDSGGANQRTTLFDFTAISIVHRIKPQRRCNTTIMYTPTRGDSFLMFEGAETVEFVSNAAQSHAVVVASASIGTVLGVAFIALLSALCWFRLGFQAFKGSTSTTSVAPAYAPLSSAGT